MYILFICVTLLNCILFYFFRKPNNLFEQTSFAIDQLLQFFNCNIDKLFPTFFRIVDKSEQLKRVKKCINSNHPVDKCRKMMSQSCTKYVKLVKTIRFSLRSLHSIVHDMQRTKIIYLTRDPKAIINSRFRSPFLRNITIESAAHAICDRYKDDFHTFLKLKNTFPLRMKMVSYEKLIEQPVLVAKDIYRFLNLTYTNDISTWIKTVMTSGKTSGYYGTHRANATQTANQWRVTMSTSNKTKVDMICGNLYKDLTSII